MRLDMNNIDFKKLRKVNNFAKDKGILSTSMYSLIAEDIIEYILNDVMYLQS